MAEDIDFIEIFSFPGFKDLQLFSMGNMILIAFELTCACSQSRNPRTLWPGGTASLSTSMSSSLFVPTGTAKEVPATPVCMNLLRTGAIFDAAIVRIQQNRARMLPIRDRDPRTRVRWRRRAFVVSKGMKQLKLLMTTLSSIAW